MLKSFALEIPKLKKIDTLKTNNFKVKKKNYTFIHNVRLIAFFRNFKYWRKQTFFTGYNNQLRNIFQSILT